MYVSSWIITEIETGELLWLGLDIVKAIQGTRVITRSQWATYKVGENPQELGMGMGYQSVFPRKMCKHSLHVLANRESGIFSC